MFLRKMSALIAGLVMLSVFIAGCSAAKNTLSNQVKDIQSADLTGQVKSLSSNVVKISIMNRPEMPAMSGREFNSGNGDLEPPPEQNSNASRPERQNQFTGETKEITIPDGTKIYSLSVSQNGMQENEISVSDIKSGDMISVYYKDDGTTIEKITVMNAMGMGRGRVDGRASSKSSASGG